MTFYPLLESSVIECTNESTTHRNRNETVNRWFLRQVERRQSAQAQQIKRGDTVFFVRVHRFLSNSPRPQIFLIGYIRPMFHQVTELRPQKIHDRCSGG